MKRSFPGLHYRVCEIKHGSRIESPKERSKPMKKFSIREVETLKTTAALYGLKCPKIS